MSDFKFNLSLVVASAFIFLVSFAANELIFTHSEFVRGINWIYLPAGMRLLCTLLFGGAGAIGILIASWLTCFFYFFPDDVVRSVIGGLISAGAPYLVYRLAQRVYGLRASLTNLTAKRLLVLIVIYSVASPSLHHIWFLSHGEAAGPGFLVMVTGDLVGTSVVIYTMKLLLSFLARPHGKTKQLTGQNGLDSTKS
jgi:hypothetical protein